MSRHNRRSTRSVLPSADADERRDDSTIRIRVSHEEERLRWQIRLSTVVATAAMGVYFLVLVGGTNVVADAAVACPIGSGCNGVWTIDLGPGSGTDVRTAITLVGRLAAVLVGLCLVVASWVAQHGSHERRIRAMLALTTGLYVVQIALGIFTPTGGSGWFGVIHLVVATTVFSGLLVALCWQLEAETPNRIGDDIENDDTGNSSPAIATRGDVTSSRSDHSENRERVRTDVTPSTTALSENERTIMTTTIARVRAYVALTKPKLMWLLCLVAVTGMILGAEGIPPLRTAGATLTGGILAIGASGTFNNALERERDERMHRTADRPLVRETIPVRNALAFGLALSIASVVVFVVFVNVLAAALGLGAILFYSVVYTVLLKPHTTYNTVLGGIVGAFPALIGWAAVRDGIGLPALVLGAVIVCWTPAHFYNLALAYEDDYRRAGFPMLPVVRGAALTYRRVLTYFGATLVSVASLGLLMGLGWPYAVTTLALGAIFLQAITTLFHDQTKHAAFRTFMASNVFLGGTLLVTVIDVLI